MGMPESIVLNTEDGARIAGAHVQADRPRAAVLLLHMMPAAKESWSAFASRLSGSGIASLAIDLRGHGESTHGPDGPLDYRRFDDLDHQASRLDVEAAFEWLRERYPGLPILTAGASIGANLALRAMADHPEILAGLALSPGLDYHGVATEDAMSRLRRGQRVMLAFSLEDEYSAVSAAKLKSIHGDAGVETVGLEGGGHGTVMLERDADFAERSAAWLEATL